MHTTKAIITIASIASFASADIVRTGEFESTMFEGFQGLNMGTFESSPVTIFDGLAVVQNTSGSWLHTTEAWSFTNRTAAYEGKDLLGNASGGVEYSFNTSINAFGGFFATIANVADGQVRFFNNDTLVGTDALSAPVGGEWTWNGRQSDTSFNRVIVDSNYGFSGGFILHDAVRATATIPTPGAFALIGMGGVVITRRRR